MTAPSSLPLLSPRVVVAVALSAAAVVGGVMAGAPAQGLALAVGLAVTVVVLLDLTAGIAIWTALLFLAGVPALGPGPNIVAILVVLAWLGAARRDGILRPEAREPLRRALGLAVLILVWLALSLTWARAPDLAAQELLLWGLGGTVFVVVVTAVSTRRAVLAITAAFVIGAVVAVSIGLLTGLEPATSAVESSSSGEERLGVGGEGDPNYLAAMLVPAIALAGGLLAVARRGWARVGLFAALGLLIVGLAATQSRGGLLAMVVMTAGAMVLLRGYRVRIALALATLGTVLAVWFAANPAAFERLTDLDSGGGTGRSELWEVGWLLAGEHPVVGIGLNNFQVRSVEYARRPGELEFVEFIAERPLVVHNVYLQILVETGVVGAALFVALLAACLHAAWAAARRFDADGYDDLATLARAAFLGLAGTLVASVFLSNGGDRRLWLLLALGPALLAVAYGRRDGGKPSTVADERALTPG